MCKWFVFLRPYLCFGHPVVITSWTHVQLMFAMLLIHQTLHKCQIMSTVILLPWSYIQMCYTLYYTICIWSIRCVIWYCDILFVMDNVCCVCTFAWYAATYFRYTKVHIASSSAVTSCDIILWLLNTEQ